MNGSFCLVLHAHQPYVRRHGAWPCGEDWYHQAASESYLPLAETFARLAGDGLTGFATVSFTPVLASQMADPYLTRELHLYLGRTMLRAERQAANYRGPFRDELVSVAAASHRASVALAERLEGEWSAGTHVPWRELAGAGAIETWTSAPSHAYLPGLGDEGLIAGGFRAAVAEHERVLGVRPAGAWLPECGYRPGLEDALAAGGLSLTLLDGPAFEAAGAEVCTPGRLGGSGVTAVARDRDRSLRVSGPGGFPGGTEYRDFHHYDQEAGFKSFAVTHPPGAGGSKRPYEPAAALDAARRDAETYAREIESALDGSDGGVLVAAFDAELFGHWWFEGPAFLETLLRTLHAGGRVRPATVGAAVADAPDAPDVAPAASSWGRDGDDSSWRNAAAAPIWGRIDEGERRVREALGAPGGDPRALAQALRELLLLSASDWPYMVTMGRAADYARDRVAVHDAALDTALAAVSAGAGRPDDAALSELEERDNLLPALDPSAFL